ncbi:MAG: hypothetical protein ACP5OB_01495 [Candidatus Ratteibacteria bacterium]
MIYIGRWIGGERKEKNYGIDKTVLIGDRGMITEAKMEENRRIDKRKR